MIASLHPVDLTLLCVRSCENRFFSGKRRGERSFCFPEWQRIPAIFYYNRYGIFCKVIPEKNKDLARSKDYIFVACGNGMCYS